jgi:hypothetical protein
MKHSLFMQTESSSPHSNQSVMDHTLNHMDSVQAPLIYFFKRVLLMPSNVRRILPRDLLSSDVSTKILHAFMMLSMMSVVHALPILST